jgi:hypothetical protein
LIRPRMNSHQNMQIAYVVAERDVGLPGCNGSRLEAVGDFVVGAASLRRVSRPYTNSQTVMNCVVPERRNCEVSDMDAAAEEITVRQVEHRRQNMKTHHLLLAISQKVMEGLEYCSIERPTKRFSDDMRQ